MKLNKFLLKMLSKVLSLLKSKVQLLNPKSRKLFSSIRKEI